MKKNIIFIILLLIVAILSYQIQSFEFVLIGLTGFSLILLFLVGIINIFRKVNSKFFKVLFGITGFCVIGVLVSLFRPYDEAVLASGNLSEKLQYAYKTDQKDRMQLKTYLLGDFNERDELRLEQVKEILKQEQQLEPIDKFHAAFIYHHSDNSGDYENASKLATAAAKSPELQDHYQVQWLKKAAYDRYMVSIGKPEKYNTQNKFSLEFE